MIQLKEIRKGLKVKVKDIPLNPRTVNSIESGDGKASVKALEAYLEAIGMQLTISLKE